MAAPPPRRPPPRGRKPVQVDQSRSSRVVIQGPGSGGTSIRRGAVRLPGDVAYRVEIGHPWVYREALGNRPLQAETGSQVELLGPSGELVGVGLYDPDGAIAVRVFVRSEGRGIDGALEMAARTQGVAFAREHDAVHVERLGIIRSLVETVAQAIFGLVDLALLDQLSDVLHGDLGCCR